MQIAESNRTLILGVSDGEYHLFNERFYSPSASYKKDGTEYQISVSSSDHPQTNSHAAQVGARSLHVSLSVYEKQNPSVIKGPKIFVLPRILEIEGNLPWKRVRLEHASK